MSKLTKEECLARGIPWHDIKHRMTRRAFWRDYWRAGEYGITIHLHTDVDGRVEREMLLSEVVGEVDARPPFNILPSDNPSVLPNLEGHTNGGHTYGGRNKGGRSLQIEGGLDACCGCEGDASLPDNEGYPRTKLTALGRLVDACLRTMGTHKLDGNVRLGRYVIMPTHIHATLIVEHDLPMHTYRGKEVRVTLSDVVRGFEQGCTSWWYRLLEGETADEILANPSCRRTSSVRPPLDENGTPAHSLWQDDGFNDSILYKQERKVNWVLYVLQNAYYWLLEKVYPQLFEHKLHLMVGRTDYSAYGCMFLLGKPVRVQIFCHRLARRSQLTDEEWQKATGSWDAIRAFENYVRKENLGHFDKDWYRSSNPKTKTAVPYVRTEAFRKQKAELLAKCEQENAVLVSPAVSPGEADIFYSALEQGYSCIKLVKKVISEKSHAINRDRNYCAQRQLLVLGPWEIPDAGGYKQRFGDADGDYAKFHNLNDLAKQMCEPLEEVVLKEIIYDNDDDNDNLVR